MSWPTRHEVLGCCGLSGSTWSRLNWPGLYRPGLLSHQMQAAPGGVWPLCSGKAPEEEAVCPPPGWLWWSPPWEGPCAGQLCVCHRQFPYFWFLYLPWQNGNSSGSPQGSQGIIFLPCNPTHTSYCYYHHLYSWDPPDFGNSSMWPKGMVVWA